MTTPPPLRSLPPVPPVLYLPKRPLLYVGGPMTQGGDHFRNVGLGMAAGLRAQRLGWAPVIPHYDAFTQLALGFSGDLPVSYEEWMALDFVYLEACRAMLMLPGVLPGSGTDRERAYALALGKMVYTEETLPEVVLRPLGPLANRYCERCGQTAYGCVCPSEDLDS